MQACLHADVEAVGSTLVDRQLGSRYVLSSDATELLRQLKREPDVEKLVARIARHKGITDREARLAVHTFLGQLSTFGGIRLTQQGSRIGSMSWRVVWLWPRRFPGTVAGFLQGMIRAYGPFAATLTLALLGLRWVAGPTFSYWWAVLPAAIFATCAVHEAGHAIPAQVSRVPFVFLIRPGFGAVVYVDPGQRLSRRIALWGPLAAAGCCALGMALPVPAFVRLLLGVTCLLHALSLLPWWADGKTFWRKE